MSHHLHSQAAFTPGHSSENATAAVGRRFHRSSPPERPILKVPALWELIVGMLNEYQFDFTPECLTEVLPLKAHSIRNYCRALWPDYPGQYKLSFEETAVLIYRVCRDSKTLPPAQDLYQKMLAGQMIRPDFPQSCQNVERARRAIQADRERRANH